jgi:beta-N-acetylhexosaminidase
MQATYPNNKIIWLFIILLCAHYPALLTSSEKNKYESKMNEPSTGNPSYSSLFPISSEETKWVDSIMSKMSTRDKCAQMVMTWMLGNYISESSRDFKRVSSLIQNTKLGGIVFFKGDILNEALLINKFQGMSEIPLLIGADFERGLAMRLTDATEFPYNMAVAATGDKQFAYDMGKVIGLESRTIGVHQNYAPVADINNNSENPIINIRSYSEDKNIVSQFSAAFIAGTNDERVLSTAKHFPGHGDTQIDSHKDMPTISVDRFNLVNNELVPFVESIRAGVHSIMVGHLNVPALDPGGIPATLSKKIITDLLKNEMGFAGLVVTDAMNMSAVTNYYSVGEAAVLAVKAGNDLVLMPPDEEVAVNAIYNAVLSGEISFERINESVRKILSAKKWLQIDKNLYSDLSKVPEIIGQESHIRLAQNIAEKSITLVRNDKHVIPIDPAKIYQTACISISDGLGSDSERIFQNEIDQKFTNVRKIFLNRKSTKKDYQNAYEIARQSDLILLPSFVRVRAYQGTVRLSESHTEFINKLLKLKTPSVIISFGNPYLLSLFPDAKTYLAAYGDPPVSQRAMASAIAGEINIQGKLPISIPKTDYIVGHGIPIENTTLKFVEGGYDLNYNFASVDVAMIQGVQNKIFPGGVLLIGKEGKVIYEKPFGNFTYDASSTLMSTDAIFDLASVSKVVGTTTAAMLLYDEGKLNLDEKVQNYLPEFGNNGKEDISVRNLLAHNSGLIAYRNFRKLYNSKEETLKAIMNETPVEPIGSKVVYSDLNMIVLQQIIEKISEKKLDEFLQEKIFKPLKMTRTMYNPPKELWYYSPPTSETIDPVKRNKGVVHDGNAFILDGVAGHAGLFSTASDLAVFMQMMLQKGKYAGKQFIKTSTVNNWTKPQLKESARGLGWDTNSLGGTSAGNLFSKNSFGHTGFTGTSVWADKEKGIFVILLTNRVYPGGEEGGIQKFRPQLHDAVMKAVQ